MLKESLLVVLSYLIGGVPTGYIIVKIIKKTDIRSIGSGNIGFANVLRAAGIGTGVAVLLIDAGKAIAVAYFFPLLFDAVEYRRLLFGAAAILGNVFSPYLGFKGGKGAATGLGVSVVCSPLSTVVSVLAFGITVFFSRYVSLGSLVGGFVFLAVNIYLYKIEYVDEYSLIFSALLFIVIFGSHRSNIVRLLQGKENKIGERK